MAISFWLLACTGEKRMRCYDVVDLDIDLELKLRLRT